MTEGIKANGIHSYRDLGFWIAKRKINPPKRRKNKQEVPYMHGAYDFGQIGGETIYEEATLEYEFDIAEFTTEEMEKQKDVLLDWLNNIVDAEIEDDFIPGYYFKGSIDDVDWTEDFGEGTVKATFAVYPFKIAKEMTWCAIDGSGVVVNESSHPVFPTLVLPGTMTMSINGTSYSMTAGTHEITQFVLKKGMNEIEVTSGTGTLQIGYRKERF